MHARTHARTRARTHTHTHTHTLTHTHTHSHTHTHTHVYTYIEFLIWLADVVFAVYFVLEVSINFVAHIDGILRWFRKAWNIIDLTIAFISVASFFLDQVLLSITVDHRLHLSIYLYIVAFISGDNIYRLHLSRLLLPGPGMHRTYR